MKSNLFKIYLSLLLSLVASFSFGQTSEDILFEQSTQKFVRSAEGRQITLIYSFTYVGKTYLKIIPPKVDCSCTEVILPENNIQPNSTNTVIIKFDTSDKIGWQERHVILNFTCDQIQGEPIEKKLTFKGSVKASKATKAAYKENKKKR